MNVDQALSLLWQAARPSPHLREAVELIEAEITRLRRNEADRFGVNALLRTEQFDGTGA